MTQRAATHGHDLVDADLGRQLDRQLAAVALGQRLHEHQPGRGRRLARAASTSSSTSSRPTAHDRQSARVAAAVDQVDRLADPQPPRPSRRAGPRAR